MPSTGSRTRPQEGGIGWLISALLHIGLLAWSVAWLTNPARFHVDPGQASVETEITITAPPAPAAQPKASPAVAVVPSRPRALPLIKAIAVPKPVTTEAAPTPERAPASPRLAAAPATPRSPRPTAKSRTAPPRETARASQGALQAQPDDLHNQPPEYPDESRLAHEQGVVILRVEVAAAGEPVKVGILRSSGFFRLDQAALRAVRHWKFHPALRAGQPVSSVVEVPVRFELQ